MHRSLLHFATNGIVEKDKIGWEISLVLWRRIRLDRGEITFIKSTTTLLIFCCVSAIIMKTVDVNAASYHCMVWLIWPTKWNKWLLMWNYRSKCPQSKVDILTNTQHLLKVKGPMFFLTCKSELHLHMHIINELLLKLELLLQSW